MTFQDSKLGTLEILDAAAADLDGTALRLGVTSAYLAGCDDAGEFWLLVNEWPSAEEKASYRDGVHAGQNDREEVPADVAEAA